MTRTGIRIQVAALGVVMLGAGIAAAATPRTANLPGTPRVLRYEMRAGQTLIGQPELRVGAVEEVAGGRRARSVKGRASTFGKFREKYPFDNTLTALLDVPTYRPLKSTIHMLRQDRKKTLKLQFKGAELKATVEEHGKRRDLETSIEAGTADVVTALLWLQALAPQPGDRASVPVHSGAAGYRMFVTVRGWEEVIVPAGTYRALPVDVALHYTQAMSPGSKDPHATWRLWLADDAWRTIVRIDAGIGVVGDVVIALSSVSDE